MGDQNRTAENQTAKKPLPAGGIPGTTEQYSPDTIFTAPSLLYRGGTLASQVSLLGKANASQQQTMMRQIGRTQGNRHVQQLVSGMSGPASHKTPIAAGIQTQMSVSQPGDAFELEADRVADEVMRMPAQATPPPLPPNDGDANDDHGNQGNSLPGAVFRLRNAITPLAQRAGGNDADRGISPQVEGQVAGLRGGGAPLPQSERDFFEPRLGADLSQVRVHTGSVAVQTSRDLNARAYTVGSDIAFNAGEYQPGSSAGRRLMAHELTHVIQQTGATPPAPHTVQEEPAVALRPAQEIQRQGDTPPLPPGTAGIEQILNNWSSGEYNIEDLLGAWNSLGRDGFIDAATNRYEDLWTPSLEITGRLLEIDVIGEVKKKFEEDVIATVRGYLAISKAQLDNDLIAYGAGQQEMTQENLANLAELQLAAREYQDGLDALSGLYTVPVGSWFRSEILTSPRPGETSSSIYDSPAYFSPVSYNGQPEYVTPPPPARANLGPASFSPRGPEGEPLPDPQGLKEQYDLINMLLDAIAEAFPSIYPMLENGTLDDFIEIPISVPGADGSDSQELIIEDPNPFASNELAQGVVIDAIEETLGNIAKTQGYLNSGEMSFRDFDSVHQQLLYTGAQFDAGIQTTDWRYPSSTQSIAIQVLSEGEGMSPWDILGITLASAGFVCLVIGSGGTAAALAPILFGASAIPSALEACESWEDYHRRATAAGTNVNRSLEIVSDSNVSGAALTAAIDTVFFIIDLVGLVGDIAKATRGAKLINDLGGEAVARMLVEQAGGYDELMQAMNRAGGPENFVKLFNEFGGVSGDVLTGYNQLLNVVGRLEQANLSGLIIQIGADDFLTLARGFDTTGDLLLGFDRLLEVADQMKNAQNGLDLVSTVGKFDGVGQFLDTFNRFDGVTDFSNSLAKFGDEIGNFVESLNKFPPEKMADYMRCLSRFDTGSEFASTLRRFDDVDNFVTSLDRFIAEGSSLDVYIATVAKFGKGDDFAVALGRFPNMLDDFMTALDCFGSNTNEFVRILGLFPDAEEFAITAVMFSGRIGDFTRTLERFGDNAVAYVDCLGRFDEVDNFVAAVENFDDVTQIAPAFDTLLPLTGDSTSGVIRSLKNADDVIRIQEMALEVDAEIAAWGPMPASGHDSLIAFNAMNGTDIDAVLAAYGTPSNIPMERVFAGDPAGLKTVVTRDGVTRSVLTIGSLEDTVPAGLGGERIFITNNWSLEVNAEGIARSAANGDIVHLRSAITRDTLTHPQFQVSIFARELFTYCDESNQYVRVGNYLVPPAAILPD
ncbi:MAG: DUF4157 domain-containing protein [Anaerolineae bacterium]|nr:DUF4157 domain-containing protein [Anaerolineae bacterium]